MHELHNALCYMHKWIYRRLITRTRICDTYIVDRVNYFSIKWYTFHLTTLI